MFTLKATPGPTTYFLRLLRAVYEPDPRAELDARRGLRLHGIRVSIDRANRKGAHAGPRTRRPAAVLQSGRIEMREGQTGYHPGPPLRMSPSGMCGAPRGCESVRDGSTQDTP